MMYLFSYATQSDTCVSDHVHTFYGPQLFHPSTTNEDLRNADPKFSTSFYVENKSLYWHPSIYKVGKDPDTNEKTYELAEVSFAGPYYRWDPEATPKPVAFPPGFQMIAGMDPTVEGLELISECLCPTPCQRADGLCESDSDFFPSDACGEMGIAMNFPTCWNETAGIGDTGNHMDHMAYTVDGTVAGACPPGFDVRLPQIQLFVRLQNYEGGQYTFSDNTLPGDEEVYHADFMNGWEEGVLEQIVDECEAIPGSGDDYNPPCNCDQFLTKKSNLLNDDTEEGRNDAEAANICPIDVTKHIVDEVISFGQGGLPRGSCSTPIITGVEPEFVEDCGLKYTPNTFDEGNCEGDDSDDSDDSDDEKCKDNKKFKYKGNKKHTCKWIGKKDDRIDDLCPKKYKGKKISKWCPETCGKCDDSSDESEDCKDDKKFKYKGNKKHTCEWIGKKEERIDEICHKKQDGKKIFKYCPEACEEC